MAKHRIIEFEGTKYIVNEGEEYSLKDDSRKDHISYFPELIEEPSKAELEEFFNRKDYSSKRRD